MRALGAILVVVVTGCYSPGYRDCEITCASGTCPSGLTCDQGVCRVGGFSGPCGGTQMDAPRDRDAAADGAPDGPPGDVDADNVPNAADNCPNQSNTNQANEDNDLFGDVCDPCPIGPTAADDADPDQDGVGAACDPDSGAMNRITVFEGFRDNTLPVGAFAAGPWTFMNGQAVMPQVNVGAALLYWPQGNNLQDVITTQMKVTPDPNNTNSLVGAGVTQQVDSNTGAGIACWRGIPAPLLAELKVFHMSDPTQQQQISLNGTIPNRISLNHTASLFICRELFENQAVSIQVSILPANAVTGLVVNDLDTTFDWVMIVSRIN